MFFIWLACFISHTYGASEETVEPLLQKYLGDHHPYFVKGAVDQYFDLVWEQTKGKVYAFDESLTILKKSFVDSWQDAHKRMIWVKNAQTDIVDYVESLCDDEPFFTLSPCLGSEYINGSETFFLHKFQRLRTYCILSDVATYVHMDQGQQQYFMSKRESFFQSREGFITFCQLHITSAFAKPLPAFLQKQILTIFDSLYHYYEVSIHGQRLLGYPCLNGEFLIPAWFAALKKGMFLNGMPYMAREVVDVHHHGQWSKGSFHFCMHDFFHTQAVSAFLSLWSQIYPDETYPLEYIIEAMQEKILQEKDTPRNVLKILISYFYAIHDDPRLMLSLPQSAQEFSHVYQQPACDHLIDIGFKKALEDICGEKMDADSAMSCMQKWLTQYFVEGVKSIMHKYGFHYDCAEQMRLCEQEFNISNPSVYTFLSIADSILRCCEVQGIDSLLTQLYPPHEVPVEVWRTIVKEALKDSKCVRYRLWDFPSPFVLWNFRASYMTVFLPHKNRMTPCIRESVSNGVAPQCIRNIHLHYCLISLLGIDSVKQRIQDLEIIWLTVPQRL